MILILIPTLCYAGQAIYHAWRHEWPMATVFAGYAFANLGFLAGLK